MSTYSGGLLHTDNVVASLVTFSTPWPNHRPSPKNSAGDGMFKGEQMMTQGGKQQKKSQNLQHVPGPSINQAKVRKLKGKQRQGQPEKDAKEGPHDRSPDNATARLVMNFLSPRQHHPHKGKNRNYLKGHIIVLMPERAPTDREKQN